MKYSYTAPTVTIRLSGINKDGLSAATAQLNFTSTASTVHIYNGSTRVGSYDWTGDGDCVRTIGYVRSDGRDAALTLTARELTVTRNGVTCIFTLSPEIIINNPY